MPITFKRPEEMNFNSLSPKDIFMILEKIFPEGIMEGILNLYNSEALSMSPEELRAKVAELE